MKNLEHTKYYLHLQIEHYQNDIFVHKSTYTKIVLKRFNMDKATALSTPIVARVINVENDLFRPHEGNEKIFGPKVPYLNAIKTLIYLANCTQPDMSFVVYLLARFGSSPTQRH